MANIDDIRAMTIEELRPYVQRAMELDEWPVSDWIVVGMIFEQAGIQVFRAFGEPYAFSIVVSDKGIGGSHGTGNSVDPVTAIFRAYLTWRMYQ